MKQRSLPIWLGAAGVVLALALAACAPGGTLSGNSRSEATGTPGATATHAPGPTATSTQPGGSSGTLPSDIPAYPGARFLRATSQGSATFYFYTSTESAVKIIQFYQQQMPKDGWTLSRQPTPTSDPVGVYSKGQQHVMFQFTQPGAPVSVHALPTTFAIIVSG